MIDAKAYSLVADVVLVLHFAFVAFVVISLPLIGLGGWLGWSFVRNIWFRAAHLLAIAFVAAESLAGLTCPLTTWEHKLRLQAQEEPAYTGSFVQHWIHRAMFFEAPESVFTVIYVVFLAAVAASFWWVRPRFRPRT